MEEFPSNSHSKKTAAELPSDPDKKIEKMISGEAITRKPSGFKRLRQSFIGGDSKSVSDHVFWNVLLPAAKDTLADMGSTFIDMMIYGERRSTRITGPSTPTAGRGSTSRFNYSNVSSNNRIVAAQNTHPQDNRQGRYSPNEIVVSSRSEAEGIVHRMFELLEKYNAVSVADLYRMVGVSANYMDDKWGWTNLNDADVKRVREGVLLVLPNPEALD